MQWNNPAGIGVDIRCEISFTTTPFEAPVWVDVSADLDKEWWSDRGRGDEYDDIQPGTFQVLLDNSTRKFDPENSAGPYYGDLKPMRRIRLYCIFAAVTYPIISGYVLGWPQEWGTFKSVAVLNCIDGTKLDGTLPTSALAKEVLADAPTAYYKFQGDDPLAAEVGGMDLTDATQGVLYAGDPSSYEVITADASALPYLEENEMIGAPATGSGGFVYETAGGTPLTDMPSAVEAWVYDAQNLIITVAYTTERYAKFIFSSSGWLIEWSDNVANRYWNDSLVGPPVAKTNDLNVHHVVARLNGTSLDIIVDGSLLVTTALTVGSIGSTSLAGVFVQSVSTGAIDVVHDTQPAIMHLAIYQGTPPTVARFQAHYIAAKQAHAFTEYAGARITRALDDIGFPAADRAISPGGTVQGPYRPSAREGVDYIREVERGDGGFYFYDRDNKATYRDRQWIWSRTPACTFSDDGTGSDYVAGNPRGNDVSTISNKVTVTWYRGAITVADAASHDEYGEQPKGGLTIDSATIAFAQDAANRAAFIVRTKKQPSTVFPEVVSDIANNPAALIPVLLALELGDVVRIKRTPMSVGAQVNKTAQLLGISHRMTARSWEMTFYLSAPITTAADAPYLTLGDATRGKVGAAFGNIVPY
jgi:hypothetical protein